MIGGRKNTEIIPPELYHRNYNAPFHYSANPIAGKICTATGRATIPCRRLQVGQREGPLNNSTATGVRSRPFLSE